MNIKVCLLEKKKIMAKGNALDRSTLVALAFILSAEHGSLNANCTGFYTQCVAWVAQRSLHRLLHSVWRMAKMGLSTIVHRLLHSVHAFSKKCPLPEHLLRKQDAINGERAVNQLKKRILTSTQ